MNPFKDGQASLLKFTTAVIDRAVQAMANDPKPPVIVDWDAITDEESLPEGDLYGLMDYSMTDEGGQFQIAARICISTRQDKNLFRSRDYTNAMFNACQTDRSATLFDAETGKEIGLMKFMEGTQVLPVVTTVVRSYRYVAVTLTYSQKLPSTP